MPIWPLSRPVGRTEGARGMSRADSDGWRALHAGWFVMGRARRRAMALCMSVLVMAPLLLTVAPAVLAVDDTPEIAGTWVGEGEGATVGTATVPRDGAGGFAQLNYAYEVPSVANGAWTFSTTAAGTGTAHFDWALEGYHAWFQVTVG